MTMKQILVEEPRRVLLEGIKQHLHKDMPLPHVTELIYCLTKAYWQRTIPADLTDEEALLFSVGHGLQGLIIPGREVRGVCEGIHWSADQLDMAGDSIIVGELKTTRKSARKDDIPDGWLKQIMAYCYANKTTLAHLAILHMMGNYRPPFPMLKVWRLEFEQDEVEKNWTRLLFRWALLARALHDDIVPGPTKWCDAWECPLMSSKGRCGYELLCRVEMKGDDG